MWTVQKVSMLLVELDNGIAQQNRGVFPCLPFAVFESDKDRRVLVDLLHHPLIPGDLQAFEEGAGIFPVVEELMEHGHVQGFAESSGAGDQNHFRAFPEDFPDEGCGVDKQIVSSEHFSKIADSQRDFFHGITPCFLLFKPSRVLYHTRILAVGSGI